MPSGAIMHVIENNLETDMGTRGMNVAIIDGKVKLAQYNQWDSYPAGQGAEVLGFLHYAMSCPENEESFKKKLRGCSKATTKDLKEIYQKFGWDESTGSMSMDEAEKMKEAYPQFSRDTGSDVYGLIANSEKGLKLKHDLPFVADSLFCEWCYVVDFDAGTFEVYTGFNKEPLSEGDRFFKFEKHVEKGSEYHPVKLLKKYSLYDLPNQEAFIRECEPSIDEPEDEVGASVGDASPTSAEAVEAVQSTDHNWKKSF